MTITPANLRASFANVYFDGNDLGALRNVKPSFETLGIPLMGGQTGEIEWDEIDKGMKVTIKLELEEITFENFALAIPGGIVVGDTLLINSNVGASRRAAAKPLIIKPLIGGVETTDEQEWLTFPLAAIGSGQAVELSFNDGNQQIISANFKVFSTVQEDGTFLFCYKGPAPV
jgi:hypothetical protein